MFFYIIVVGFIIIMVFGVGGVVFFIFNGYFCWFFSVVLGVGVLFLCCGLLFVVLVLFSLF